MGIYDELSQLDSTQAPTPKTPAKPAAPVLQRIKAPAATASRPQRRHDVMEDVVTSLLEGVDRGEWREMIANTETHSSAFRLSSAERDAVEDLVRDLRRVKRVKTSMNELARLGLMLLIHDFRKRGDKSIVYRVKKT